jgi:hypothetical protein
MNRSLLGRVVDRIFCGFICCLSLTLAGGTELRAADDGGNTATNRIVKDPTRDENNFIVNAPPEVTFWNLSLDPMYDRRSDGGSHEMKGLSTRVSFGLARFLSDQMLMQGNIQILSGPWGRVHDSNFDSEFNGVGFDLKTVIGLRDLRAGAPRFPLYLDFIFADRSGKSLGRNLNASSSNQGQVSEKSYKINNQDLCLEVGMYMLNFYKPRPSGNTLALLTTRIEGWGLHLGLGKPLVSRFKATTVYNRDPSAATAAEKEVIDRGQLGGLYMALGLEFWIGS